MAKSKYADAFAKFEGGLVKVAYIDALDSEISYRELTQEESDGFNKRLIKEMTDEGKAKINYDEATVVNYEKVALCLIDPPITVEQLHKMPVSAQKAMAEIVKLIDGNDKLDAETGNQDD